MARKLTPVPDTLEFGANVGDTVTVFVSDANTLLIQRARYADKEIVIASPPTKSIAFSIVEGRQTLEVVCVFSTGTAGNGQLQQDCGGGNSQPVRDVPGTEPLQVIIITGKKNA
jgi:hypothetical protein